MQTTNMMILIFCYVMFFMQSWISTQNNNQRLFNEDGSITSKPGSLIGSHIIGILWLGMIPIFLLKNPVLQIASASEMPTMVLIISYFLVFALIIVIAFKQSSNAILQNQPAGRPAAPLPKSIIISYFLTRAIFLVLYELFFRGFLLFETIASNGIGAAVILNVILYAGVHVFNSKKEMQACIPFGILVCFFSIAINSVWPAVLLHLGFSLVFEFNFCRSYFYSSKLIRL